MFVPQTVMRGNWKNVVKGAYYREESGPSPFFELNLHRRRSRQLHLFTARDAVC